MMTSTGQYDYAAGQLTEKIHKLLTEKECSIFNRGLADYHKRKSIKTFVECLSLVLNTGYKRKLLIPIRDAYVKPSDLAKFNQLVQAQGLATSYRQRQKAAEKSTSNSKGDGLKKIDVKRDSNGEWGFSIRGGSEHGLGIFVSWIEPGSNAEKCGLQVGDQILKANDTSFTSINHYDAVMVIQNAKKLQIHVLAHGRVPGSRMAHKVYHWVDPEGRPCSPPPDPFEIQDKAKGRDYKLISEADERKVTVVIDKGRDLGISIRGGIEHGLGIYISAVEDDSVAESYGLKVGDQILEVNGVSFLGIVHADAASSLRAQPCMVMKIKDVGKLPHSRITTYSNTKWYPSLQSQGNQTNAKVSPQSPIFSSGVGSQVMLGQQQTSLLQGHGLLKDMAKSVLNEQELALFMYHINQYQQYDLPVDELLPPVLNILDTPEKLQMLTELRGLIKPQDIERFNELTVHKEIMAKKHGSHNHTETGRRDQFPQKLSPDMPQKNVHSPTSSTPGNLQSGLQLAINGDDAVDGPWGTAELSPIHSPQPPLSGFDTSVIEARIRSETESRLRNEFEEKQKKLLEEQQHILEQEIAKKEEALRAERQAMEIQIKEKEESLKAEMEESIRLETERELSAQMVEKEKLLQEEKERLLQEERHREDQFQQKQEHLRQELEEKIWKEADEKLREEYDLKRQQEKEASLKRRTTVSEKAAMWDVEGRIKRDLENKIKREYEEKLDREMRKLKQQENIEREKMEVELQRKKQEEIARLEAEEQSKIELEEAIRREAEQKVRAEFEVRLQNEAKERVRLAEEVQARKSAEERLQRERLQLERERKQQEEEFKRERERERQEREKAMADIIKEKEELEQKLQQQQNQQREQRHQYEQKKEEEEKRRKEHEEEEKRRKEHEEEEKRRKEHEEEEKRRKEHEEEQKRKEALQQKEQQKEQVDQRRQQQQKQQPPPAEESETSDEEDGEETNEAEEMTAAQLQEQKQLEQQRQMRLLKEKEEEKRRQQQLAEAENERKQQQLEQARKKELERKREENIRKREENLRKKEEERKQKELERRENQQPSPSLRRDPNAILEKEKKRQEAERIAALSAQQGKSNGAEDSSLKRKKAKKAKEKSIEEERRKAEERLQRRLRRSQEKKNAEANITEEPTVPAVKSYAGFTDLHGNILRITVTKVVKKLGIAIDGGANTKQKAVIIREISPEGCAAMTGMGMAVDQQILEVNGTSLFGLKHREVVMTIKAAFDGPMNKTIDFVVLDSSE